MSIISLDIYANIAYYLIMKYKTVGEYLKANKIRQREFGALIGIHQSHISEMVNGKYRPRPELAAKIEEITGIPLRTLLGLDNEEEE